MKKIKSWITALFWNIVFGFKPGHVDTVSNLYMKDELPNLTTVMKLADQLKKLGYDEKTSARYARLIGESPEKDEQGNVLVKEYGQLLAKIKLD